MALTFHPTLSGYASLSEAAFLGSQAFPNASSALCPSLLSKDTNLRCGTWVMSSCSLAKLTRSVSASALAWSLKDTDRLFSHFFCLRLLHVAALSDNSLVIHIAVEALVGGRRRRLIRWVFVWMPLCRPMPSFVILPTCRLVLLCMLPRVLITLRQDPCRVQPIGQGRRPVFLLGGQLGVAGEYGRQRVQLCVKVHHLPVVIAIPRRVGTFVIDTGFLVGLRFVRAFRKGSFTCPACAE